MSTAVAEHLNVNFLAIASASVAAFVLKGCWYEILFKESYHKEIHVGAEATVNKSHTPALVGTFAANVATAFVLAHAVKDTLALKTGSITAVGAGLHAAFSSWFGFVVPVRLSQVFWGGSSWKLFGILTGEGLVSSALMGAIIGYFAK